MVEPTIVVVFVLNFFSLLLNGFGICCLQVQRGGNVNQRLLLQNLSTIEIAKILNDYVSFTSYYVYREWYFKNYEYFDFFEMHLLTVFFSSLIFTTVERLVCITLNMRYKAVVTKPIIQCAVIVMWMLSFLPGLFFWICHNHSKDHYYLFFDVLILILSLASYLLIWIIYQRSRLQVSGGTRYVSKQLRILRVPFLIVTMFVISNCIPDIIFTFYQTSISYNISAVMWSLGFLTDPCVYIFINKSTREAAKRILRRLSCGDLNYEMADSFKRMSIRMRSSTIQSSVSFRRRTRSRLDTAETLV